MALNKEQMREYMRKRRTEKRDKTLSGEGSTQPLPEAAGVAKTEASALTLSEAQGNAAQNNLPVPAPTTLATAQNRTGTTASGDAREGDDEETATQRTCPVDSRGGQSFSYDKKKYPNRGAWEIAVQRVERAVRYAQMFPNLIGSDDLKFQTVDWQHVNEGLKAPTS